MFEIGELVVYGNRGVFQVNAIGQVNMGQAGNDKNYYTLTALHGNRQTVYIPVDSVRCPLRKIITKEETLELIDRIPVMHILQIENEKIREQRYKESMDKHACEEWMMMLKTIYGRMQERRSRGKRPTSMDERYMQVVKRCLLEEFAASLSVSKEEVEYVLKQKIAS